MARKSGEQGAQGALPLRLAPASPVLQVGPCNREAVAAVLERPWSGALYLVGPAKSGKSLIASLWAAQTDGRLIAAPDVGSALAGGPLVAGAVAVDAVERIAPEDEEALFHLFNATVRGGGRLLLTGRVPPRSVPVRLADLATRLRSIPVARIEAPDDMFLEQFLARQAEERQLVLPSATAAFLLPRMARSYEAAINLMEALDRLSLERGRPVTRELAAQALKRAEN